MVAEMRPSVLSRRTLRDLDPDSGWISGWAGVERAIRRARTDALREILDAGLELDHLDLNAAIDGAAQALDALAHEVARQEQDPNADPFWRTARHLVLHVGAAFLALMPERLDNPESRRIIEYEVDNSVDPRRRAYPGNELWTLLTQYHLRQARGSEWHRRESGLAVAAMAVAAMTAIDDIDPVDLYDDHDTETIT